MNQITKQHLGFTLTIFITYVVGIMLIILQYKSTIKVMHENANFLEICLNSIVPTTITYVLGCILVNLVDILRNTAGRERFIFNIITCLSVFLYALLFAIYLFDGFSVGWVIGEFIATLIIIVLNIKSYAETFQHRHHKIV